MARERFKDLIISESIDYLAINKPPGISTLEDRSNDRHILAMARKYLKSIKVCHRIDKDTSGVLVFAKNDRAYKHLAIQFQERKVTKIYHAVVHGASDYHNYIVDVPLSEKAHGLVKWDKKEGKTAKTIISTIIKFKLYSVLECRPITGKRHQIRAHLKYISNSIVSDKKYNGYDLYLSQIKRNYKVKNDKERPIINRMALHARSITFKDLENNAIKFEAPYAKDFVILLKQLDKYCSINLN